MTIQIQFIDEAEYLLVELSGEWDNTHEGVEVIHLVSEHAKNRGDKRILVDRRNLSEPITQNSRYEAGVTIAKLFRPPFRIAFVLPHGEMTRFGEDVAVNRGATAEVFSDMEDAKRWLLGHPSA